MSKNKTLSAAESAENDAVRRDGAWFFPLYDNNGNITEYVDENGAVVAHYAYDAFGNTIGKSGALADTFRFRFSTKYYDAETGLYYYGYRFYYPSIMRWLNRDPIEEKIENNLYAYCHNQPIVNVDVLGKSTYWKHYMNYALYPPEKNSEVWKQVGGGLYWLHLIDESYSYYNSCALRVSRTFVQTGSVIPAGKGVTKNNDFEATRDVNKGGYNCKEHTGWIKKGYSDPYYHHYERGEIWVLEQ